jgi:acetyl-CoA carboxylase biotin carboxyl carrier protein
VSELANVQGWLAELLGALTDRPRRVRLSAGDVTVEIDWSEPVTAGSIAGPPDPVATAGPVGTVVPAPPEIMDDGHFPVCSPTVGTFYRAAEPGGTPFVTEDQPVRAGQQIAIVEAMKLMLPVEADRAGRVARILAADGDFVEYGTPLMSIVAD